MEFNSVLENIKVYEAGKPIELVVREFGIDEKDIIKLASNENPYGTSPKVIDVIQKEVHKMYMYPDDSMHELKESLANRFDLNSENIIIGAGSDQVIEFAIRAKANDKTKILTAKTTFAMYEIYTRQIGSQVIKTASNVHKLDELLEVYKNETDISVIFLCLPNNPLGESLDKEDVFKFLKEIDEETLVVVDGAYQEYASYKDKKKKIDPKELIETFPNTLYLGTFSKAFALGGMRAGYGIGNREMIQTLHKLRPPFNITTLSLKAATTALKDEAFVHKSIKNNFIQMKRYEDFATQKSIKYIESYTNFITYLIDDTKSSKKLADLLLKKGIIIRDLTSYGINAIRVTVGTEEQNSRFFHVFEEIYDSIE